MVCVGLYYAIFPLQSAPTSKGLARGHPVKIYLRKQHNKRYWFCLGFSWTDLRGLRRSEFGMLDYSRDDDDITDDKTTYC